MLTDILFPIFDHLETLGVPCYLADCVPQGTALPYITAEVQPPLHPGMEGSLTLIYWCTGEKSNFHRLNQANRMEAILPHRGLWLYTDAGSLVLTHDKGMQCITQHDVRAIVFHFKLKLYPKT